MEWPSEENAIACQEGLQKEASKMEEAQGRRVDAAEGSASVHEPKARDPHAGVLEAAQ